MCDGNLIFVSLTLPSIFLGSPASSQLYLVTIVDEKKEEERTLTTTIMKTSHFVCLCLRPRLTSSDIWQDSFHFRDGFQILSNLEAWLLKYYEIFPTSFNQVSQHMLHSETRLYLSLTSNKCIRRFEWSYFAFFAFSLRVKRKRVTKIPAFPQIQFQTSKTFYEEYSKESAFERTLKCQKGSIFPV